LPVYHNEYEEFAFCVNSCELVDVSFKGSPFTWWNGRIDHQCIFKRLDRYLMNQACLGVFGMMEAEIWQEHDLIMLLCYLLVDIKLFSVTRPFRFLKFWTGRADFQQVVKDSWVSDEVDVFISLKGKMKKTKIALSKWSRVAFGDVFKQLSIREEIVRVKEELFEAAPNTDNRIEKICAL